jgi:hypothetical protein
MQRCGKHFSALMNEHATIKEAVFPVGTGPRPYNEDIRQQSQCNFDFDSERQKCGSLLRWQSKMIREEIARKELGCEVKT